MNNKIIQFSEDIKSEDWFHVVLLDELGDYIVIRWDPIRNLLKELCRYTGFDEMEQFYISDSLNYCYFVGIKDPYADRPQYETIECKFGSNYRRDQGVTLDTNSFEAPKILFSGKKVILYYRNHIAESNIIRVYDEGSWSGKPSFGIKYETQEWFGYRAIISVIKDKVILINDISMNEIQYSYFAKEPIMKNGKEKLLYKENKNVMKE